VSERTAGILIDRASEWGHGELTSLLMRAGVGSADPGQGSGLSRSKRAGAALRDAFKRRNDAGLVECARLLLNGYRPAEPDEPWVRDLVASLRTDGYLAERHATPGAAGVWGEPTETYEWTVGPLGADELPLPPQAGSVQRLLEDRGFTVAANHYGQAYRAYSSGDLEASNAQLRAAFESIAIEVARTVLGSDQPSGGAALDAMNRATVFVKGEFEFLKGLWQLSHANGSHPGLSSEQEALFRFTAITAALQFLVQRFA